MPNLPTVDSVEQLVGGELQKERVVGELERVLVGLRERSRSAYWGLGVRSTT